MLGLNTPALVNVSIKLMLTYFVSQGRHFCASAYIADISHACACIVLLSEGSAAMTPSFDTTPSMCCPIHLHVCRGYLSWKESGPSAEFQSLMRTADLSPWCQMCIAAAQRRPHAFDGTTQQALALHRKTKQAFDRLNAQLDREAGMPCRGRTAWWQVQPPEGDAALWIRDEAVHVHVPAG
jgi:hypothetical protein